MANNCGFSLKARGSEKDLSRLLSIMNYTDSEYRLYRIFEAVADTYEESNTIYIYGDCAWSVRSCMLDIEFNYYNSAKKTNSLVDNKGVKGITIDQLAKILNLDIEIWSEEYGCGFQEHYIINHNGEIEVSDCVDAVEVEVGDDEWEVQGGFPDYCIWHI